MNWRYLWLACCLCGVGCTRGAQSDRQYIGQARSLAAEWALVNELDARNALNRTYVDSMHRWLSVNLRSAAQGLSLPNSDYGKEINALLATPPDAPPVVLRAHARRLKAMEDALEPA